MKKNFLLQLILVFTFCTSVFGQAGALDASFGTDGKVVTEFYNSFDCVKSVALQADGKILVAGYSHEKLVLVRYTTEGDLDADFGNNGIVTTNFEGIDSYYSYSYEGGRIMGIQSDGKILVFQNVYNPNVGDILVARYLPNGVLDAGFGSNGIAAVNLTNNSSFKGQSMEIQPDGKILIAGNRGVNSNYYWALARLNPNGTKDNSFGTAPGLSAINLTPGYEDARAVALQPDGKIVAAGGAGNNLIVARFNSNGNLDDSFSDDGWLIADSLDYGYANDIAILPNGKILTSGYQLVQFNEDGTFDDAFGANGVVELPNFTFQSIALLPDGNFFTAYYPFFGSVFGLAKFNPDGTLDHSFNGIGLASADFGSPFNRAKSIAVSSDGKIVLAGDSDATNLNFAVARFHPDGSLDNGFNGDGKLTTNIGRSAEAANAVAVQPDGKIVTAGWCQDKYALARYDADGSLDEGFGSEGLVTVTDNPNFLYGSYLSANSLVIEPSGAIITGGNVEYPEAHGGFLSRFFQDGSFELAFEFPGGVNSISRQSDGKLVTVGSTNDDCCFFEKHIKRYKTTGSLDSTFGSNGKVVLDYDEFDIPKGVLQADGKILVVGANDNGGLNNFAVARYGADGTKDTSFGINGLFVISGTDVYPVSAAVQSDGKIVLAGLRWNGNKYVLTLARSNANGTLDHDFGVNGISKIDFGGGSFSLAIQPDGKILAAGQVGDDFALARFLTDGTLDSSFGTNGMVTTDFNGGFDDAHAIALQPDGKIVVAGESDGDFAVARYLSGLETGVFEKQEPTILDLSPNPATDYIKIHLPEPIAASLYVQVFNAQGRLALLGDEPQLDVKKLMAGMYTLKVVAGERVFVGKFVKQ